ncbi:MAG: nucleotidyltransferase [Deltaproteobacteria bacterium]|nr:nucleotidyltransferase [Deltaproteobacteria bacterium]
MATNPDFKDLFASFNDAAVEYLVVGAHAVMVFTEPRYTKDLDLWVRPSAINAKRVLRALAAFGAPLQGLSETDFSSEGTIFQMGVAPNRIDVITTVDGLRFEDSFSRALRTTYGGVPISVLGADDLVINKRTVARPQDLLDLERLERALRKPD